MDQVMVASFVDEFLKIAAKNVAFGGSSSAIPKPPSLVQGSKVTSSLKPQTKQTDYTVVHNQGPSAAVGTADASKATPPPPVVA